MNELPENCLHLIYKYCFDEVLKEFSKVKETKIHELSSTFNRLSIEDLKKAEMSYNFIYLEEKYIKDFDTRFHCYSNSICNIKHTDDFIKKVKELDKSSSIFFRDHSIIPTIGNNAVILIQLSTTKNRNQFIGMLCNWKQYLQ
tara:strand:- start:60 stop:488 length:429 start_codon:yes stop_codon:yes gene_type:complete